VAEGARWVLRVMGRVQGVGYRERVRRAASRWHLSGEVWNESDGTVSIDVSGPEEAIALFETDILAPQGASRPDQLIRVRRVPKSSISGGFSVRL
jgi:acylphosphatase